mgnify:CR=1 FL=1
MKSAILNILNNVYGNQGKKVYDSREVYFIVNNSRCAEIIYVFSKDKRTPLCICKVALDSNLKKHLKIEASALSSFKLFDDSYLNNSVPDIIWEGDINGHYVIIESFCSGILMSEYIIQIRNSKQELENLIFSVTNWLIRIAKSKKEDSKNNSLSLMDLIREALLGYQKAQHLSEYEKNIIQGFCSNIREKEFITPVLQHGDFSPINIIYNRNNNSFFVLDWGYANFKGIPLIDLFGFLLNFFAELYEYRRARKRRIIFKPFMKNIFRPVARIEDFLMVFYKEGWQKDLVDKYINKYCSSLNISVEQKEILFVIFILRHLYYDREFISAWFNRDKPDFLNFYFMAETRGG